MNIPDYNGVGIYALVNQRNGKMYIGSSVNIRTRAKQHMTAISKHKVSEAMMTDVMRGDKFEFKILERIPYGVSYFYVFDKETEYIRKYKSQHLAYNAHSRGGSDRKELTRLYELHKKEGNITAQDNLINTIKKYDKTIFPPQPKQRSKDFVPYNQKYDHLHAIVPKGNKEQLQAHAQKRGESLNAFIVRAIGNQIERDRGEQDIG